jgi:glutamate dehydrogenase/leucine dehydrogenase
MTLSTRQLSNSEVKDNPAFKNHEAVYRFEDKRSGLVAFIAIHSSKKGSALGGTRFFPYQTEEEALTDALNLSYSMTYKCAVANLAHGGAKGVIIGNPKTDKNPELLDSYARAVETLAGKFYTGEDVGIDESDVQFMLSIAPYFIGKSDEAGDPSEYASLSVFTVMQAAAEKVFGVGTNFGRSIAIKGVGKVGLGVLKLIASHKPRVFIADIDGEAVIKAKVMYPEAEVLSPKDILSAPADIYCPCALGNEFTSANIQNLKAKLICGGANNQIIENGIDMALKNKGVLYIPDYLANAGGLINVADELEAGGYKIDRVFQRIQSLTSVFETLYQASIQSGKTLLTVTNASVENSV